MAKTILPANPDYATYWQQWHQNPAAPWQPAIQAIATRHDLPADGWERSPRGRNVVFLLPGQAVLKITPPIWAMDNVRERTALGVLAEQLPTATPRILAGGELDGWPYLLTSFIPGDMLSRLWPQLGREDQLRLASQHGAMVRALHEVPARPAALRFDWPGRLAEQQAEAAEEMRNAGVAPALIADLGRFLDTTAPLHRPDEPDVLLQGDLSHVNLLATQVHGQYQITGQVDFGDTTLGQAAHEFISPLVHDYQGDRDALQAFFQGYGLPPEKWSQAWQNHLMARIAIYYAAYLPHYLAAVPQLTPRQHWEELAMEFCQLSEPGE